MSPLKLSELNRIVQNVLSLHFTDTLWVVAEISDCREAANGHCYMELVEKEEERSGGFTAKARANVWRNVWQQVKYDFQRQTGRSLATGLKILAEVSVQFHEVYGYSLTIHDIDATYTLGEQHKKRQHILQQLEEDGVLTLNQELVLPLLVQRIAVISAEGAAGYGDFMHQLEESGYGFQTQLFSATMQGTKVAESVIAALDTIATEFSSWDVVVIIRGGGATSDLDGFEDYELAANVAQFPLPIITGIGHERDDTVIDFVAHTRCKTPTAVAAFLIETMQDVHAGLNRLEERLSQAAEELLTSRKMHYERLAHRYSSAAVNFVNRQQVVHHRLSQRIAQGVQEQLFTQNHSLQALATRLHNTTTQVLERNQHKLSLYAKTLHWADPQRTLAMGYSITYTADGKVVKVQELLPGTPIRTVTADGEVWSSVTETSENQH